MHVHWGGVFYFLTVDMRLRQETKGKESLDTAWFKFKHCCLSINSDWPVEKLIHQLDQLTGTSIFEEEYKKLVHSKGFGDYYATLIDLGITIKNNKVQLSTQETPAVNLRSSIGSTSIK